MRPSPRWPAHQFGIRRLDHVEFPYVYLDATYLHVRNQASQVTSMAAVVATGITTEGARAVLGIDIGDSEDEVFWRAFLRWPWVSRALTSR